MILAVLQRCCIIFSGGACARTLVLPHAPRPSDAKSWNSSWELMYAPTLHHVPRPAQCAACLGRCDFKAFRVHSLHSVLSSPWNFPWGLMYILPCLRKHISGGAWVRARVTASISFHDREMHFSSFLRVRDNLRHISKYAKHIVVVVLHVAAFGAPSFFPQASETLTF